MSLKKQRIHITGISNIDYKSKKDIEKIFNNFKNYKIKPDKSNEPLDPTQIVVYKKQNPKKPNMYNVSLKDVVEQDGDSLLYADTYKLRRELKLKRLQENVNNKLKNKKLTQISNDSNNIKSEENKQSDETRLKELRKKVQSKLIPHKDIRNIFVSWQKNYLKNDELSVFDLHKKINELGIPMTYNEAIALISCANKRNTNSLNFDEFKNLFFHESNELNGGKSLSSIKIPEIINTKQIEDDYKMEQENKYKKFINNKIFDNFHYNRLESMLHIKYSNFLNSMKEINNQENNNNGLCDFQTFKSVLDTLKIPEKYKNFYIAKSIFNEYKIENSDLMNYNEFIERCKKIKKPNNFFEFQNDYLNLLSDKLSETEKRRNEFKDILIENDKRTKEYAKNLGSCKSVDKLYNNNKCLTEFNQQNTIQSSNSNNCYDNKIRNNINLTIDNPNFKDYNKYPNCNHERCNTINGNKRYDNKISEYQNNAIRESFSHYQPSLNFINLLFKDSKSYTERYNNGIKEFSPNNVMNLKKEKRSDGRSINSRFFHPKKADYPPVFMSYDSKVPSYINEKERFEINKMDNIDKKYNLEKIEKMNRKKNEMIERWNNMIKFHQKVLDVKESLGQINRTKHLYDYENRNLVRHTIDE